MKLIDDIRAENLKRLVEEFGSLKALAERLGKSESQVSQWVNRSINFGTGKPRGMRSATARAVEVACCKPEGWLDVLREEPLDAPESTSTQHNSNAEPGPRLGSTVKVPVVGSAQLGDNGFRAELEYPVGHGDGFVEFAARDANAYALRCVGDSMKPRIKDGEFVVVYPNHTPGPGDEVLVRFTDGRVMVKEMLYIRDNVLHLLSINEAHGKVTAPLSEVEKIHYVAAIAKKATWAPE